MLKVLIVDDEINICRLIVRLIDWEDLGLQCVGMAHSGMDAYEMALQKQPDVTITDIRMSGMDGLTLIEKLKAVRSDQKFIIISGYKSFSYAYTAIKFGVMDFLLKPINKNELNGALKNVIRAIQGQPHRQMAADVNDAVFLRLRRQFLLNVMHKDITLKGRSPDDINAEYFYNFGLGVYQMCILHIDKSPSAKNVSVNILEKIYDLFATQFVGLCVDFEYISRRSNQIVIVMNYARESEAEISGVFGLFTESAVLAVQAYPFLRLTVGTGRKYDGIEKLFQSYKDANHAIISRLILGTNRLIECEFIPVRCNDGVPNSITVSEGMKRAVELLDTERLFEEIDLAFQEKSPVFQECPYFAYSWSVDFFKSLIDLLYASYPGFDAEEQKKVVLYAIEKSYSIDTLLCTVKAILERRIVQIGDDNRKYNHKLIGTAKQFIDENYASHLTLEDVAAKVYLSAGYFGILFKKETGMNFSEHVALVRIEKSKALLESNRYKISEVSQLVGYKDSKYFSNMFRKLTGVKPTEYRRIHRSK